MLSQRKRSRSDMKGVALRALAPIVAIGVLAALLLYGGTALERISYAVAAGESRAAREQLAKLAERDRTSELFRQVAAAVKPSVVVVHVKKRVRARRLPLPGMDDFLKRFFGQGAPSPFGPGGPPSEDRPQQEFYARGLGSGVIVDAEAGHVLTNWHVVHGADEVEVVLADDRRLEAEWVRTDRHTDVAVIKVAPERLVAAPLGDSDKVRVGDLVLAVGAPERLPQTVTAGIISAKGRTTGRGSYEDFLQTDAAINHGNSGGPLVNMRGEVIGINTAIISRTGVNEGIGLAVPANMARRIMEQLVRTGKVVRGYLGVTIQDVGEDLAESFGLPGTDGVLVTEVVEDGPAAKAGLKAEDFITAVNGKAVANVNELRNRVAELRPGATAKLAVCRKGKKMSVQVAIGKQPAEMAAGGPAPKPAPKVERKLGLTVSNLTDELARRHGFEADAEGVIVTAVDPGSDAAEKGLGPGLMITRVQGRAVKTVEEFRRAVAAAGEAGGVRLLVVSGRGGRRYVFVEFNE